ncbi:PQ loop repeat protein-like protein [Massariosphaeria phaeospora]|uniref:PQ loop repeat protein-like protein n=1 Tax=Massariosphaeria phaeospora TaxID=100035 RepID=A0A7C8M5V0_9PLEO|nr:PQ loop repeat protein-like protein [Massariosphaeria phaeospora]
MAPQTSIPLAATVLGTIGTVFWAVQLVPQIYRNYRTKSTEGLPAAMMLLWSVAGVPFGVYAVVQRFNVPLMVQPQCFCVLCGVAWAQCMVYSRKWRVWTATLALGALLLVFAGVQVGLVLAIRPAYAADTSWPVLAIGILAFVVLIAGYLPIPFELLKRRGRVVGIDFVFLAIDWNGAFFSLMALVAQREFDVLFGSLYALCCAIEMGMVVSHLVWMARTRRIRRTAAEAGVAFDECDEGVAWQEKGWDVGAQLRTVFGRGEGERKAEAPVEERGAV